MILLGKKGTKRLKLGVGILIILATLWVAKAEVSNFMNPIKHVSEVTDNPGLYRGRTLQVVGGLVKGSMHEVEGVPNSYEFQLTDGNATINVVYTGELPGTFREDVGITVIGRLVSPNEFRANKLLVKCPSKYEAEINQTMAQLS